MNPSNGLQISLSKEGIRVSMQKNEFLTEINLSWNDEVHFPSFLEKNFQLNWMEIKEIEVEIINNQFLLIPNEYFSDLFVTSFLDKSLGIQHKELSEVHHQVVEKEEATLSFYIPSLWKDYMALKFPLSRINYSHFMGNKLLHLSKFLRNQMHVWLESDLLFVLLRKNGKLQVLNAFGVKDALESAFYLHSLREAFQFVWTHDTFKFYVPKGSNLDITALENLNIPIALPHEQA